MTLLNSAENRELGIKSYAKKRTIFEQSHFVITRKFAQENAEWSPAQIAAWQRWVASQTITIWRISQLS